VEYAVVQDIPSSWEQYQQLTARLIDPLPNGLLLHVAGPTDEGYRVIDIWESETAWESFYAATEQPAHAERGRASSATVRTLRARVVAGL
jgi:hypothetical protein